MWGIGSLPKTRRGLTKLSQSRKSPPENLDPTFLSGPLLSIDDALVIAKHLPRDNRPGQSSLLINCRPPTQPNRHRPNVS